MNWKDLIAKGLRHFGLEIYNPVREKVIPTNYMCFDPDKKRIIPKDQANYDPLVFGRYNLTFLPADKISEDHPGTIDHPKVGC